jgi:dihydrofolate reductase
MSAAGPGRSACRPQSAARGEQPCLSLIVAMARNRVIGAGGRIPWRLPAELALFRRHTLGHHVIMGRRTFESIGRPLPGRVNIVLTRRRSYRAPGALVVHSLEEAIAACRGDDEVFVIGGAELYAQALPLARRLYLTTVEADFAGDAHMPPFDPGDWRLVCSAAYAADERNAYPFRFELYERSQPRRPEP